MICGRINRPVIPLTLFLLSYPFEQLEFIRLSNFRAELFFARRIRPQILPRNFQSRYRRHLFHFKSLFLQSTRARRSLNQSSRLRVHVVQEFYIGSIQSRQNVFETNIVVVDDHIPQMSLPFALLLLRAHRRSRWLLSPRARAFL